MSASSLCARSECCGSAKSLFCTSQGNSSHWCRAGGLQQHRWQHFCRTLHETSIAGGSSNLPLQLLHCSPGHHPWPNPHLQVVAHGGGEHRLEEAVHVGQRGGGALPPAPRILQGCTRHRAPTDQTSVPLMVVGCPGHSSTAPHAFRALPQARLPGERGRCLAFCPPPPSRRSSV